MGKIIIEYQPSLLSDKAKHLIKAFVNPSMIAHDNSSAQYDIDQCKERCEEYDLIKDVIVINNFMLNSVAYIEL